MDVSLKMTPAGRSYGRSYAPSSYSPSSYRMPPFVFDSPGEPESGFSFSLAGSDGAPTFNATPSPVDYTPPPVNGLAGGFAEGSTVTFHGLKSSSKHNGAQGRLVKFHADKERWQVQPQPY